MTSWHLELQAVPTLSLFACRFKHLYLCAAEIGAPITMAGEVKLVDARRIAGKVQLDVTRIVLLPCLRDFCTRGLVHAGVGNLRTPDVLACLEICDSAISASVAGDSKLTFRLTLGKAIPVVSSRR